MKHNSQRAYKSSSSAMFRIIFTLSVAFIFGSGILNAQEVEDVTPPTLLDFNFTPTVIDTTNSSQQVTVTVQASDDLSGVLGALNTCFLSPAGGGQEICGGYREVSRSGTPEVVTFEGVFTFPQFAESGTWHVLGVTLIDNARNTRDFTTADLQALGFNTQLEVISVQDVTPPTLLDFNFTPTVIDTTNSSQQVTVTVQASDDLSGVRNAADTCFFSPFAIQEICGSYREVSRSGTPEVVTFEGVFTFPQFAELGTWRVLGVTLIDNARNTRDFTTADLQALGFNTQLEVISVQDVTPPTLLDFNFTPTVIDTTNSSQQVTVTVQASDDLSGVRNAADTCFFSPFAIQEICGSYREVSRSGTPEVVTFEGVFTFPQFAELGTWRVFSVSLTDNAVNRKFFTTADLQAGGFPVELINAIQRIQVQIDIKPGSFPNSINLGSSGTVPVAILSTPTFDARTVDPLTVTLTSAPVKLRGKGTPMASFEDIDEDGLLDLVVHVSTETLQLSETATEAVLEGETFDGIAVRGVDSVRVVP